jgi:Uma2 family endonuclease
MVARAKAVRKQASYTADDLWEMASRPEYADRQLELIEGELRNMAPASFVPSILSAELAHRILGHVRKNDLGYVTSAEGGFKLSDNTVLAPDVGFIAKARITKLPERFIPLAPDLAVEVVSPTDSVLDAQRKAMKYIAYGTPLVWILYPKVEAADVCRPSQQGDMSIQRITTDGMLDGGDVLPGFSLPLRDLFSILPK